MRIAFVLHGYPPLHNAGAEWYAHRLLVQLAARGHQVQAVSRTGGGDFQGVEVVPLRDITDVRRAAVWADVLVTHLNETRMVESVASRYRKPLVHVIHNHRTLRAYRVRRAQLIVFNSYWLYRRVTELPRVPRTVLWPMVPLERMATMNGGPEGAVGLVNLMEPKGAPLFYQLASRLPDRMFEGVKGSYGIQVNGHARGNLVVHDNQPGLEWWWPRVGVYVQPSSYESFGMSAVEAMAHGIPVVAAPTPGLLESVGPAGAFHKTDDLPAWVESVRRLGQSDAWSEMSVASRDRGATWIGLQGVDQLEDLELHLERL